MNKNPSYSIAKEVFLIVVLVLIVINVKILAIEYMVSDEIYIENMVYKPDRKSHVFFTHLEHAEYYEIECTVCHHEYNQGINIWEEGMPVKKCITCHLPNKSNAKIIKLRMAYHINCKGCHKTIAKVEGYTNGPFKHCEECHQ